MFNAKNPFKFPKSSFNQPVTPPDLPPDEGGLTSACFSTAWLPVVLGALDQLLLPSTWIGDEATVTLAQERATMLKSMIANPQTEGACEVPAPYWDNAEDSDDEQTAIEQVWYGIRDGEGNFIEQIADWILTGFIAAMFTPHAAVMYATYVPKFRLWFRRDGAGAIVRILINGVLAQEIDTYSAIEDVTSTLVVADVGGGGGGGFSAMAAPYTITVEHTGTHNPLATPTATGYGMTIIRSRLSTDSSSMTTRWYDNGQPGGVIQTTWDNGTTWVDTPEFDPRRSQGFRFTPTVTDDNCQVAHNITQQIRTIVNIFLATVLAVTTVNEIVATVTVWIPGVGQVIDFVAICCAAIAALGAGVIQDAFTEDTYHEIQCALDCNLVAGALTDTGMTAALERLNASLPWAAYDVTYTLSLMFGAIGFTNAGTIDAGTAPSCDDCNCAWVLRWNFADGLSDWTITYGTLTSQGVHMVSSQGGWASVVSLSLSLTIPVDSEMSTFKTWYCGTSFNTTAYTYRSAPSAHTWYTQYNQAAPLGGATPDFNTGALTLETLIAYPFTGGDLTLTGIEITGTGNAPLPTPYVSAWPPVNGETC